MGQLFVQVRKKKDENGMRIRTVSVFEMLEELLRIQKLKEEELEAGSKEEAEKI